MASAYQRPSSPYWWIKYRGHGGRTARISTGIRVDEPNSHARALSLARQQETSWVIVDAGTAPPDVMARALAAVHDDDATADAGPVPLYVETASLANAADAHRTVRHEREVRPNDYKTHMKHLRTFAGFAGVRLLRDLKLHHVEAWIEHLRHQRLTPAQRHHRIVYLRCAASMMPTLGLPNPIAGQRLNRRRATDDADAAVVTLQWHEVIDAWQAMRARGDLMAGAFGLMAFVGLRPSEAARLRVCDLRGDVVVVGAVRRKNSHSRRELPMPASLAAILDRLAARKAPSDALLSRQRGSSPGNDTRMAHLLNAALQEATGRPEVTAKHLRKTFASVAIWDFGLEIPKVEAYLGHAAAGAADVTTRHYLSRASIPALRPIAERFEAELVRVAGAGVLDTV